MLAIAGTAPDDGFPLTVETARLCGQELELGGLRLEIARGTPALLAAAAKACEALGLDPPTACLVGDAGLGRGSRRLYDHLADRLAQMAPEVLVFHYLQPEVDGHGKVFAAVQALDRRPVLVADAGFMYAAKMSGYAPEYDLFTPDAGELAFLADEQAPHPFYTRGFILQDQHGVPELVRRAYRGGNAARWLLVKGSVDHVASRDEIAAVVSEPSIPAMEAMGGSGDTVTGLAAALIRHGLDVPSAARAAALANRLAAQLADPSPASQIAEIIQHLPEALQAALDQVQP
jgi:NAD(P)H-hydrate repair Nnr-like enzyme with NAD(P)H-hydrate dehydratase domain